MLCTFFPCYECLNLPYFVRNIARCSRIAMNISPRRLRRPDFIHDIDGDCSVAFARRKTKNERKGPPWRRQVVPSSATLSKHFTRSAQALWFDQITYMRKSANDKRNDQRISSEVPTFLSFFSLVRNSYPPSAVLMMLFLAFVTT